jgi:hypothetical protein
MLSSWDLRKRLDEKSFKIVYGQRPSYEKCEAAMEPAQALSRGIDEHFFSFLSAGTRLVANPLNTFTVQNLLKLL